MLKQFIPLLLLTLCGAACKTKVPQSDKVETSGKVSVSVQSYIVSFSPTLGCKAIEEYVAKKGYHIKYRYARSSMLSIEVPASEKRENVIKALKQLEGVERVSVARTRQLH